MSKDVVAIGISNISKSFRLPHERHGSLKSLLLSTMRGGRRAYEKQHVLNNVSFDIEKGEFFGIIGRNGSGKSTLLKMLAGIYSPDKGHIKVNGKLTPFIELGVGFNPELTGRENVFLNGALLGFSRKEMLAMYDDIVSFAELEKFMDQKLKNYSSGMQVRLAFSIAIKAETDILVLDEVLAVGDMDFQQKCYDYFNDLRRAGRTVVLVTHDMGAVRKFCTKAALINQGRLEMVSSPEKVAKAYEKINLSHSEEHLAKSNDRLSSQRAQQGDGSATIEKIETLDSSLLKVKNTFHADERIGVRISYEAHKDVDDAVVGFIFQDIKDATIFATNSTTQQIKIPGLKRGQKIILEACIDNVFTDGEYTISCAIQHKTTGRIYDRVEYAHKFLIAGHPLAHAAIHGPHTLTVKVDNKKV